MHLYSCDLPGSRPSVAFMEGRLSQGWYFYYRLQRVVEWTGAALVRYRWFMRQTRPKSTLLKINPEALFIEGYDDSIIGIVWNTEHGHPVALYDAGMLLEAVLQSHPELTATAAFDWVEMNLPLGPHAPCIVELESDDEEDEEDPTGDSDWC